MKLLFSVACCGVTEQGKIWAAADGDELEVDQMLGAEMLRDGYAVLAPDNTGADTAKLKKVKKVVE